MIRTGRSLRLSVQLTIALALGLLVLAPAALPATAAPPPGGCSTFTYKGDLWAIAVKGVSCSFAKSWFPKMYAAHSQPGGKWNGPTGWLCIKVQRDPGFVQKGVCGKGHQEMAWRVIVKK